jgi:hypothetical protein
MRGRERESLTALEGRDWERESSTASYGGMSGDTVAAVVPAGSVVLCRFIEVMSASLFSHKHQLPCFEDFNLFHLNLSKFWIKKLFFFNFYFISDSPGFIYSHCHWIFFVVIKLCFLTLKWFWLLFFYFYCVYYSEEEAKKKIYNVSCERYFGFGCKIDEETSNKLEGIKVQFNELFCCFIFFLIYFFA